MTTISTKNSENLDSILEKLRGSKKKNEILAFVTKEFDKCKKQRVKYERQWYLNLAFYLGRQYAVWHPGMDVLNNKKLYVPPAPPWRVRLISNKIRPIIRTELSKITKEKPQFYVVPASTDEEDLTAARAGEAIFEHLIREVKLNKALRRAVFWNGLCGVGFLKAFYDNKAKDSTGASGAIKLDSVTPFHIFVPLLQQEDLEKQPYVIHAVSLAPDQAEFQFGKKIKDKVSARSKDSTEDKLLSALEIDDRPNEYVVVKEMWVAPNRLFSEGAVIKWADDTVLDIHEGWPYTHSEYPFVKLEHIPTGRFYTESSIVDLIPLQKEYNRTRSQITESKNRMAKPQLVAPRGAVKPSKITSEPGLLIEYVPGYAPPTPLPLQNLPSYVLEEQDRIQRDLDDISGQHEVTKGRTPPGVTAATAIAYLQEEDDSKLAWTISSVEEAVEKLGVLFLSYVHQFWNEKRKIKIMGEDRMFESFIFDKASIKGNTDLKVEAGSATPRSRAAKQAFLMEIGKLGWLPPDRILRYLDMAETGKLYRELQIDSQQAKRENLKMAKLWKEFYISPEQAMELNSEAALNPQTGQTEAMGIFPVNSWDEHQVHLEEHNNFRKKQEFEALPEQAKVVFEWHVKLHEQEMQKIQMEQISMGMVAPGEPPGGPGRQGLDAPDQEGSPQGLGLPPTGA